MSPLAASPHPTRATALAWPGGVITQRRPCHPSHPSHRGSPEVSEAPVPGTREKTSHRRLRWPSPGATAPCWLPGPCPLWAAVGVGGERGLGGRRQASERVVATAGGGGGLACFSGSSPAGRRAGQGCRAWATHRDPVCVVCRAAVPHHASSSPSYEATCRRPRRSPSRPRAGPGSAAGALPWQHKDSGGVMVWPGLPLTSVISWRWWLSPLPALPLGPFPSLGRDAILRGGLRRPPSHPLVLEGSLPTK